jgi:hypothetical protein
VGQVTRWARSLSNRSKWRFFGTWFAVDAILALFPPLYWAAGSSAAQKYLPWSVVYFLVTGACIVASVTLIQFVERVRGELE